ncbi:translocation/assembly module TamB domain-containing protein [Acidicapsa acidisoli]|uniref:translocation/assembly module TamB domain-containing protein n=1 Tax=Acidicapsa acidisoli TaxID=1615681 RepID=UPI0021E034A7|nr:translocation/assembly module TamB domain-containing protein [Acidicapsa acidisoli]
MTTSNVPGAPETGEVIEPEATPSSTHPPTRRKWRWKRHLGISFGVVVLILVGLVIGLYYWASSAAFEDTVRHRVIAQLTDATGGRVEMGAFHWDLLHLRVEADGITIHGLEGANEAPYAHVDRLRFQIAILDLFTSTFSPRIILREAEILRPEFHLIVYSDGSTNQPHPRRTRKSTKPAMDTLFDAQIGQLAVEQGTLHIADLVVPLDLQARDANLQLSWVPDSGAAIGPTNTRAAKPNPAGSYRVLLSLGDLGFAQGNFTPPKSRLDASLTLFHDSVQLDSLRLAALDQTLSLKGTLTDFAHPAWQGQASGQVDLRVLAPYTGFFFVREGVVTLNASASGRGAQFGVTGDLASSSVHYRDPVVDAQSTLTARFRADAKQLVISDIRTRLVQGGEVDGEFQFENWLDFTPTPAAQLALRRAHKSWPVPTGMVRANLNGVSLDTILTMLAAPPYRHLGLDTVVSGPATAQWTGLAQDLAIGGQLALAPSGTTIPGEAPVQGFVDGTFHADAGSINVRAMDVKLPHSRVQGEGSLGVFPITRASEMELVFQSTDLSEFDSILRTLELKQGNRVGSAALPVALKGEAQFRGQFNSSWLTPRVEGHLTASNIGIEIPSANTDPNAALSFLDWDSIDVDGLYTPASIVIHHGLLRRGAASLTVQGHLDADDPEYKIGDTEPEFDARSVLSLKADAEQFPLSELLPLAGISAPIAGKLSASVSLQGQLGTDAGSNGLSGTGNVDLDKLTVYGESIDHIHAVGSVGGQQLKITSLTARQSSGKNGGQFTATGSYDLAHKSFKVDARGSAIDLASISEVKSAGVTIAGRVGFTAIGDGAIADPHFVAHATVSNVSVAGEPVADLHLSATAAQRALRYDLNSHQSTGDFTAHGETSLKTDYLTQASLQFSKFDIGALLKLLHITGINGQSNLEGTANISGPLAHPEKLRGEAKLNDLAVVVEGVHLASKGAAHATLMEGVARLDPLEITGEDTDLKLHGSVAITGKRELDLQADGSVNMRLAETLDPDLIASGATNFQLQAHGSMTDPILQGRVEFKNASLALQDFPNGLSQIQGTLEFNQNRLEVRSLTAMSGGGQLSVAGYLGFQHGLYADLSATGKAIRLRYPQGVSSLADANLRLQGPQNNLLLNGTVMVTRFAINSDLDIAALTAQTGAAQPIVSPDAPSNHLRLDVHLTSAPQLNFQNAYAKLAGDVDLHLRGTLASPSLLGRISLTEGSTTISGTKYELQRGDINFSNPVRIQPIIDVDATARVEDYDITIGLHGSSDKPRLSYRSEPPLPEADIIALLALGHTQDEGTTYSGQTQQQAGDNPMTDALLGGALNATVSNRVQRLFGTGAIKVDPNFIGTLGNSTARVTVVEQIGNNLTFTYASNVNTTTQQLIQAEIAINRHVSLVLTQDESGIFSMVVKIRRRFK